MSAEGLVIDPSTSLPVRAFGFRLWPPEAGVDSSDLSERSNSAPALRECRTSLSCCHSAESVSRRTQDDIATGTRTLNGSAHCVRSIQPCLCFERRGLNQVGGITEENLLASSPYPKAFRVSTSWCFRPGRPHIHSQPQLLGYRPLPERLPSWQSNMLPNPNPKCKRFFCDAPAPFAPGVGAHRDAPLGGSRTAPTRQFTAHCAARPASPNLPAQTQGSAPARDILQQEGLCFG